MGRERCWAVNSKNHQKSRGWKLTPSLLNTHHSPWPHAAPASSSHHCLRSAAAKPAQGTNSTQPLHTLPSVFSMLLWMEACLLETLCINFSGFLQEAKRDSYRPTICRSVCACVSLTLKVSFPNIQSLHYTEYYNYIGIAPAQVWIIVSARLLSHLLYTKKYCHNRTVKNSALLKIQHRSSLLTTAITVQYNRIWLQNLF